MWTVLPRGSYLADNQTGGHRPVVAMNITENRAISFLTPDLQFIQVVGEAQANLILGGDR
jgi:hypothetical protein